MPNPSTSRGPAGDPSLDTFAPPRAEADPRDAEQPVLFRGVTWDDYEAMLRIRGERRFRITYDRGLMEVVFPHRRERFSGVSWDDYEAMLRIAGDGPLRTTYDRGEMEVIMPSYRHEALTRLFQTLLTDLLRALRVPYKSGGSTTFRRLGLARGWSPTSAITSATSTASASRRSRTPRPSLSPTWRSRSRSRARPSTSWRSTPPWASPRSGGSTARPSRSTASGRMSPTRKPRPAPPCPRSPSRALAVWLLRGLALDEMAWGDRVLDWIRRGMPPLAGDEADAPDQP